MGRNGGPVQCEARAGPAKELRPAIEPSALQGLAAIAERLRANFDRQDEPWPDPVVAPAS
ncbi:hypothetical protein ACFVFF_38280 [Streptomyces sp. NPDC057680]|uniref:hypothetical protein n=1 Tax=Streptomyces sp. NPDC057680 TaxID=3346208 RepID=UPI003691DD7C